jgi:site-specific recombinase XerD
LAEISAFELERHRRQRKQNGVSDVMINRELAFLRHLYTMAITWGKATENPVKKVRFAREDNGRVRMLNPREEELLLAQCAPHLKPLIITALHTGFRASELLSLSWADIDFNRRVITVRAAYAKNGERRSVPNYNMHHRDVNHGFTGVGTVLIILTQSPVFPKPAERPFYASPFRQNTEAFGLVGALDDFQTDFPIAA